MRVRVILLRDPRAVLRALAALRDLTDARGRALAPRDFWRRETYTPHPRFVNCYLVVILPPPGRDPLALARRAAELLEARKGVVLDWCAGTRAKGKAALLFVKPRAADAATGKEVRVRIGREDIAALARLAGAGERRRER
ncbi:MAG: hypothetical protein ACPLRW_11605 [Moorellales bacterium]